MAQHANSQHHHLKHIREEDFNLIQKFESFEAYQLNSDQRTLLPALSKEQFLIIKGFSSYADFKVYLFDTNSRDWTSDTASVSCTAEQFDADYDLAIAELESSADTAYNDEGEEDSCNMTAYDCLPYTKGREVRANRRKNTWIAQKRAFHTEEILKAREEKEDRELQTKAKVIQKALWKSGKARSKEDAKHQAEAMVSLKPNVRFTRVNFGIVYFEDAEEIVAHPYKKKAAKTFHEKHRAMRKCAAYQEKLQEIRDMTLQVPGHDRSEAKHACNVKHSHYSPKKSETSENNMEISIHPAYNNALVRILNGKHHFPAMLDAFNTTPVKLTFTQCPITGRILSILCTTNHVNA